MPDPQTIYLDVCGDCIQPEYCRQHEQCHYTKTWLRNPDGTAKRWIPYRETTMTTDPTTDDDGIRTLAVRMAQEHDVNVDFAEEAILNLIARGLIKG